MTAGSRRPWCVVGRLGEGRIGLVDVDGSGERDEPVVLPAADLAARVAAREAEDAPRWVWSDTAEWYPVLLDAGIRIGRCVDLRLVHAVLRTSQVVREPEPLRAAAAWDVSPEHLAAEPRGDGTLFSLDGSAGSPTSVPDGLEEALAEFDRQRAAAESAAEPGRLRLLLAAESAGALVAAELHAAGMPWDAAEHDRLLREALGPRPHGGQVPVKMAEAAAETRDALDDRTLSLDSPPRLLRALRRAGIDVASTSRWELEAHEHPAIAPLLRYKKLSRLLAANGWWWIDEWVHDGRYRPVYVPAGVVTGRWASSGGGALQIPRQLRPALRADPGWLLVSADVAQLEPRVLAAMAGDAAMAAAGAATDLYAGIVETGVVETRTEAKVAVLGALYGSTTGDSARLVPRLRRTFPDAMRLVDRAAEVGEVGGTVTTWLGRSSPPPDPGWSAAQTSAHLPDASTAEQERAVRAARSRGRFTRNFVVQGTAAEWALAWMADLRLRLARFEPVAAERAARASGPGFDRQAHLAFFLHDEVIVHAPAEQADAAATAILAAADAAGRLLFPGSTVDFPLDLHIAEHAGKA